MKEEISAEDKKLAGDFMAAATRYNMPLSQEEWDKEWDERMKASPEACRYVARQADNRGLNRLCQVSKLPKDVVGKLILSERSNSVALQNMRLSEEELLTFIRVLDVNSRVSLTLRKNLPLSVQEILANDEEVMVRTALSKNKELDYSLIKLLIKDSDLKVVCSLVRYQELEPIELGRLAGRSEQEILINLAHQKKLSTDLMERIYLKGDAGVKVVLASNPELEKGIMAALAESGEYRVNMALIENPKTSIYVLELLAKRGSGIKILLAQRQNLEIELIKKLSKDKNENVREIIAKREDLPPGIIKDLAKDRHRKVRGAMASNHTVPLNILSELGFDKTDFVRRKVAANEVVINEEIIKKLVEDTVYDVAQIAIANKKATDSAKKLFHNRFSSSYTYRENLLPEVYFSKRTIISSPSEYSGEAAKSALSEEVEQWPSFWTNELLSKRIYFLERSKSITEELWPVNQNSLYTSIFTPYGWKGAGKTEWLLWSKTNESKTWKTKLPQNFEGWGRIVELTKEKGRFVCPLNSQKSREVWWETELVPGEFGSEGRIPNIETNYMKRLEEFKGNLYYPGVQAHLEGLALIGFGIYALWGDEYGPFGWTIEETANVAEERKIHGGLVSVYDRIQQIKAFEQSIKKFLKKEMSL